MQNLLNASGACHSFFLFFVFFLRGVCPNGNVYTDNSYWLTDVVYLKTDNWNRLVGRVARKPPLFDESRSAATCYANPIARARLFIFNIRIGGNMGP